MAAVSNPGRGSQRTDLSPAAASGGEGQPQRLPSGQPYGQRSAMQAQQAAAPMQSAPGALPEGLANGVFSAGTRRPNEGPDRNRMAMKPTRVQNDPDLLLRAIYAKFPHPDIERMLLRRRRVI